MKNKAVSYKIISPSLAERIKNSKLQDGVTLQGKANFNRELDKVEINNELDKQEKKGPMERFSNFVGSAKKRFARIIEYTKGGFKGAFSFVKGILIGTASIFAIHKTVQGIKMAKNTNTSKFKTVVHNITDGISRNVQPENLKNTLKSSKGIFALLGGVTIGALAFLYQIYKAKLMVNQKTADLDHKYYENPHDTSK